MSFLRSILATQIGTTTVGAILGKTALVSGLVTGVTGRIAGGVAQERQARLEADIAEIGAISEETRASEERTVASQQEIERREKGRRDVARVISRTAAQGFELAGTPLLIISEFLTDIEQDIGEIRFTGEKKARAAESRAVAKTLQGMTLKQIGKAKKTEALFEAGSSLLTGIGNIFNP
jgi:hypothetical protein